MRAVVYARLSNTRGGDADISVNRQLELAHAYVATRREFSHDCARDDFIEPKGMRSGFTDAKRPAYRRLMAQTETKDSGIGLLWSYDLARLTRGDDLMLLLMRFDKAKVEVVTERDPVDIKSLSGRTNTRFKGLLNTWYRDEISDRLCRAAQTYHHKGGAWWGRAPFGCKSDGHGSARRLVASDKTYKVGGKTRREIDTVIEFFKLYTGARAIGLERCARTLNERGYRGIGGRTLTGATLLSFRRSAERGTYNNVIDAALIRRFLARVKENAGHNRTGGTLKGAPPLLWGVLRCKVCGHRYSVGRHPAKNFVAYAHYRADCPEGKTEVSGARLDAEALDIMTRAVTISTDAKREAAERIALASRAGGESTRRAELETQLKRLESTTLLELLNDGKLDKETYVATREGIEQELESLRHVPAPEPVTVEQVLRIYADLETLITRIGKLDGWLANRAVRDFGTFTVMRGHIIDYEVVDELKGLVRKVAPRPILRPMRKTEGRMVLP